MYRYGDDYIDTTTDNKINNIDFLFNNYNTIKKLINFEKIKKVFKWDKNVF